MAAKLDIHGVHFEVDENLQKYITKKINKLDKYLSPETKGSAHAEIFLSETKARSGKVCECEVVYHLPKDNIRVKEGTINIYAAVDIVEEKLKQSLKKYKDLHHGGRKQRHLMDRLHFQF